MFHANVRATVPDRRPAIVQIQRWLELPARAARQSAPRGGLPSAHARGEQKNLSCSPRSTTAPGRKEALSSKSKPLPLTSPSPTALCNRGKSWKCLSVQATRRSKFAARARLSTPPTTPRAASVVPKCGRFGSGGTTRVRTLCARQLKTRPLGTLLHPARIRDRDQDRDRDRDRESGADLLTT